jgi:ferredoxin
MTDDAYRRLARRLDEIPNGFPATESGVEIRLLQKIFEPDEAALASVMKLSNEPASDIAARAGADPKVARRTLKRMVRKGQILVGRGERQLTFRLMPFAVGFYEEQLPRMDKELAELFEEYLQESKGGAIALKMPAIARVIPVEEAVPVDLEIFPYERASELLENAKSWAVRDCICRVQTDLVGKGCDHPVENCITFAPIERAFVNSEIARPISKDEALRILHEAEEAGLVHSTGNYRDDQHYICNCCTCSCGILRTITEFGFPTTITHSDFRALVDADICIGCGTCLERCQFGALSVPEDVCLVDPRRCVGCGLCATVCPVDAIALRRVEAGEKAELPTNRREWMEMRAEARGIDLEAVL